MSSSFEEDENHVSFDGGFGLTDNLISSGKLEGDSCALLTKWQQVALCVFWWGVAVWLYTFVILIIPSQIAIIVGDASKGRALGLVICFFIIHFFHFSCTKPSVYWPDHLYL